MNAPETLAEFITDLGAECGLGPDDATPYTLLTALSGPPDRPMRAGELAAAADVAEARVALALRKLEQQDLVTSGIVDDAVYFSATDRAVRVLKTLNHPGMTGERNVPV